MTINKDQIIETVSKMSIADIMELINAMEKKFNISSNNVTSNQINSENPNVKEEKTEFKIILKSIGKNKIAVIKAVRSAINLGLKEAKDLVESAPVTLKENMNKESVTSLEKTLREAGAEVEVQ